MGRGGQISFFPHAHKSLSGSHRFLPLFGEERLSNIIGKSGAANPRQKSRESNFPNAKRGVEEEKRQETQERRRLSDVNSEEEEEERRHFLLLVVVVEKIDDGAHLRRIDPYQCFSKRRKGIRAFLVPEERARGVIFCRQISKKSAKNYVLVRYRPAPTHINDPHIGNIFEHNLSYHHFRNIMFKDWILEVLSFYYD